jgi:ubiquinol-cytochrome c reductase cytochrome b subunit
LLNKILPDKLSHFLACSLVFALVGAAGVLTVEAIQEDRGNADFQANRVKADVARQRALFLAGHPSVGVPPEGSRYVLLNDPLHTGSQILEQKCLSCHYYNGQGVKERSADGKMVMTKQSASDLFGFGSRSWIRGLLENPADPKYFGTTPQCGGMQRWKKSTKLTDDELDKVADFVALFTQVKEDETPNDWLEREEVIEHPGLELFKEDCGRCHMVDPDGNLGEGGEEDAPNLFGWGSSRWTARMIRHPNALDRYGFLESSEQMPGFDDIEIPERELKVLLRYLKGDYIQADSIEASTGE